MQYLIKVTRHVQSTQNRKLVTFLQYLNKKRLFDFVCGEWKSFFKADTILLGKMGAKNIPSTLP